MAVGSSVWPLVSVSARTLMSYRQLMPQEHKSNSSSGLHMNILHAAIDLYANA